MVFVEVQLCLLDIFQFQVAFGQTGVSLHFFELQRVLAFLLVSSLFGLALFLLVN